MNDRSGRMYGDADGRRTHVKQVETVRRLAGLTLQWAGRVDEAACVAPTTGAPAEVFAILLGVSHLATTCLAGTWGSESRSTLSTGLALTVRGPVIKSSTSSERGEA